MNSEQLQEILDLHKQWISDSKTGKRADLSRADLYRANLRGAVLYRANLSGADLSRADLSEADLIEAKFTVELYGALNLSKSTYDSQQFPFLALNPEFFQSVKNEDR